MKSFCYCTHSHYCHWEQCESDNRFAICQAHFQFNLGLRGLNWEAGQWENLRYWSQPHPLGLGLVLPEGAWVGGVSVLTLQSLGASALGGGPMAAPLFSMPNLPWASPLCLTLGWVLRCREERDWVLSHRGLPGKDLGIRVTPWVEPALGKVTNSFSFQLSLRWTFVTLFVLPYSKAGRIKWGRALIRKIAMQMGKSSSLIQWGII